MRLPCIPRSYPLTKQSPAVLAAGLGLFLGSAARSAAAPDLSKDPTLYLVGYAHLDTEWCWDYQTTINDYLPATLHDNFALFEKYPHYVFNFTGANRYRMMKEYWPADYATLKK